MNERDCWDFVNQTPITKDTWRDKMENSIQIIPFWEPSSRQRGIFAHHWFLLALVVFPSGFSWYFCMVLLILVHFYREGIRGKINPSEWNFHIFMGVVWFYSRENSIERKVIFSMSLCCELWCKLPRGTKISFYLRS